MLRKIALPTLPSRFEAPITAIDCGRKIASARETTDGSRNGNFCGGGLAIGSSAMTLIGTLPLSQCACQRGPLARPTRNRLTGSSIGECEIALRGFTFTADGQTVTGRLMIPTDCHVG